MNNELLKAKNNDKFSLPVIPAKRYFTIGEASDLCCVEPHVLRYWEQQFPQLHPIKRRGRRYYQHKDVEAVRKIRELLYEQGFTIQGAKQRLPIELKESKKEPMLQDIPPISRILQIVPTSDDSLREVVVSELEDVLLLLEEDF